MKYFIIVGEESADNHGSYLMQSILHKNPKTQFLGIGGKKMIKLGLQSIEFIEKMSIMGFIEIIKHLRFFHSLMKRVLSEIDRCKPDQIILVDYPGFNLHLAKKIKEKFDIPITYYISPQIWAWREKRIEIIRKYIDQMLVIFSFEESWYQKRGINAKFVGHPIYFEWQPSSKKELCNLINIEVSKPIITLYPGSRIQEVQRHLPILLEISNKLKTETPEIQIILGVAKHIIISQFDIPNWIHIEKKYQNKALECADLAIIASGTATVEAAVFGTPMIIIYKMAPISWWISRKLVNVSYAGMVNILANSMIMPEILQNDISAEKIYNIAKNIINDPAEIIKMKSSLLTVQASLKGSTNIKTAAEYIIELN